MSERYCSLLLSLHHSALTNVSFDGITIFGKLLSLLSAVIITYVSGRLNRIEKNKILLVVAGALFTTGHIAMSVLGNEVLPQIIGRCCSLIILVALGFAYAARFEEHSTAGLEDK